MELKRKLEILSDAAKYDASCASSGSRRANIGGIGNTEGMGICHSYTPDGRCVSLLKLLLTNHCLYDCSYCINRISSDIPRAMFKPEEVVSLTLDFYRRNYIEGLFLSTGVVQSVDRSMELMVEVARSLRQDHLFGGYIHLKAVPGASPELLRLAGLYADRVSANIELPSQADLDRLAPAKSQQVIEGSMQELRNGIEESRAEKSAPPYAPAGQSTQLIVGATESSDAQIVDKAVHLYRRYRLRRVYYSAFSPIPDGAADLPLQAPPLIREHRLYQTDWLLRFYGFEREEILDEKFPNLDLKMDPKLSWAIRHPEFFPVDVNKASRSVLLRVPGLGVRNVHRILQARRYRAIREEDLAKMRVSLPKVRPFLVTANGSAGTKVLDRLDLAERLKPKSEQLDLFSSAQSARSGEL